jgi:hypothetical protein
VRGRTRRRIAGHGRKLDDQGRRVRGADASGG